MKKIYHSNTPAETKKISQALLTEIIGEKSKNKALVMALEGDLGGGKTTFLQGFAKALGIKDKILSPTFVIMKSFQIPPKKRIIFKKFYHFDCYRLAKGNDILSLGFSKIISDPFNIVAVEWSEKIKDALPPETVKIKFDFINGNKRKIEIIK
jgi:tRNA threonylcarbamoyladenosine biosynthesis protein TsaE